jgi:fermentation-respiration switch protein FrsA (DUF1100 family)
MLVAAGGFAVLVVAMMWLENWMVYPAPRFAAGEWDLPAGVEDVWFESADGTRLHGWFAEGAGEPQGTLLYFHGNGEHVAHQADLIDLMRSRFRLNVLVFDYRGYGRSEGRPSEAGIQQDARAALAWLNERTGTTPAETIYFGRSLGAAVAVELAVARDCRMLVLSNAFSSMPDVAANVYPWLPVRWLMRNRYPSLERIRECHQPLLQAHGTDDTLVPIAMARRLFEASPATRKKFVELEGEAHNDGYSIRFWQEFEQFITEIDRDPPAPGDSAL